MEKHLIVMDKSVSSLGGADLWHQFSSEMFADLKNTRSVYILTLNTLF